jgi:hypothetical protein
MHKVRTEEHDLFVASADDLYILDDLERKAVWIANDRWAHTPGKVIDRLYGLFLATAFETVRYGGEPVKIPAPFKALLMGYLPIGDHLVSKALNYKSLCCYCPSGLEPNGIPHGCRAEIEVFDEAVADPMASIKNSRCYYHLFYGRSIFSRGGDEYHKEIPWGSYAGIIQDLEGFVRKYSLHFEREEVRPVPVVLIDDWDAALTEYRKDSVFNHWCDFGQDLRPRGGGSWRACEDKAIDGYAIQRDIEGKFEYGIEKWQTKIGDEQDRLNKLVKKIAAGYIYNQMANNGRPHLVDDYYKIIRNGWTPIIWRGTWPNGFCLAYCPKDSPNRTIPDTCVPAAKQLTDGGYQADGTRIKRSRSVESTLPLINKPVINPSTWGLMTTGDVKEEFAKHFVAIAESTACRRVVEKIAVYVKSASIKGSLLCIEFRSANGQDMRLTCALPYTGSLAGLPASCATVVRRHNGMRLEEGRQTLAEWYPFAKGLFTMEWDAWWTPDPKDPLEPFPVTPLVPVSNGDDIWLLHPTIMRKKNEPAIVAMEHETGSTGNPLPYGAGGVFLRLMLTALTHNKDDGGLVRNRRMRLR